MSKSLRSWVWLGPLPQTPSSVAMGQERMGKPACLGWRLSAKAEGQPCVWQVVRTGPGAGRNPLLALRSSVISLAASQSGLGRITVSET